MQRRLTASAVVRTDCELGEAPLWDEQDSRVLWLDVRRRVLHSFSPLGGQHHEVDLPWHASCLTIATDGRLLFAGQDGVRVVPRHLVPMRPGDTARSTGSLPSSWPSIPLPFGPGTVVNDGACDPQGRLWIGSADAAGSGGKGSVLRVAGDGSVRCLRRGLDMSNGIGWSVNGRRAYHVDTGPRRMDVLDLSEEGDVIRERPFLTFDQMPDGLAVDDNDGIWVAFWDGGSVRRYSPSGTLDTVVDVPSGFVTSCAFGPSGGTDMYITTAAYGQDAGQIDDVPPAGSLFSVDVGLGGAAVHHFSVDSDPSGRTAASG